MASFAGFPAVRSAFYLLFRSGLNCSATIKVREARDNLDEKVSLVLERREGVARAGFQHQRRPGLECSGDRVIAVGQGGVFCSKR